MKYIIAAALLLSPGAALAQQHQQMPVLCIPTEQVEGKLRDQFHETPVWVGRTASGNFMFLTQNVGATQWTLYTRLPSGLSCIISTGDKSQIIGPATGEEGEGT